MRASQPFAVSGAFGYGYKADFSEIDRNAMVLPGMFSGLHDGCAIMDILFAAITISFGNVVCGRQILPFSITLEFKPDRHCARRFNRSRYTSAILDA